MFFCFFKVKEYELSQVFNHQAPPTRETFVSGTEFSGGNDVFDYKVHPFQQQPNLKFASFSPAKSNVLEKKEIIRKNNKEKKTRKLSKKLWNSLDCLFSLFLNFLLTAISNMYLAADLF